MFDEHRNDENEETNTGQKRAYVPPTLQVFGRVTELTAGGTAPQTEIMVGSIQSRGTPRP